MTVQTDRSVCKTPAVRRDGRLQRVTSAAPPAKTELPVVVVMGVSGTGKSTVATLLAKQLDWPQAEGDDMHPQANIDKMRSGQPLTDEDRWPWLHKVADWIGSREAAGGGGVITCSALKRSYRDLLRDGHPSTRFVCLVGSRELLFQRLSDRQGHFMPASLLDSQLATFEPLGPDEPGVTIDVSQSSEAVEQDVVALIPSWELPG